MIDNQKESSVIPPDVLQSDNLIKIINTTASPGDIGHLIPICARWDSEIDWIWTNIYFEQTFGSEPTTLEIINVSVEGCFEEDVYEIYWAINNDWINGWHVDFWLWYSSNGSGTPGTGLPPGEGLLCNLVVNVKPTFPAGSLPLDFDTSNTWFAWTYNETQEWITPDEIINGTLTLVNLPPSIPAQPSGPSTGTLGYEYTFSTNTTDPEEQQIKYGWDWNGSLTVDEWTAFYNSSETIYTNHSWTDEGTYETRVKAQDTSGNKSNWSSPLIINIINEQPETPVLPEGPITLKIGQSGLYSTSTQDPDGHMVQYHFDWGDETYSDWTDLVDSGQIVSGEHSWISPDVYIVKVQARDEFNKTSAWSNGLSVTVTVDGSWSWWSMFRHDSLNLGSSPSEGPTTDNIVWTANIDGTMQSCAPAVVDDRIYITVDAAEPKIYCLNANDGSILWMNKTDEFGRSPAVYDDKVFLGAGETIYCWDAATGAEIWKKPTNGGVYVSPVVSDDKIYIGSWYGEIYCFNTSDGAIIWNTNLGYGVHFTMSSPCVANGKLFIGSTESLNGKIFCLNATSGNLLWTFTPGCDVKSSPAFAYGNVYFGGDNGKIFCLDSEMGQQTWEFETTAGFYVRSSPSVANSFVYIGSADNYVYCLDAFNGTKKWMFDTGTFVYCSPVVADEKIYIGHLASAEKNIICLNAENGTEIWSYSTSDGSWSSPAIAYGKLYIGGSGKIICFGANNPPENPNPPSGPTDGIVGVEYTFFVEAVDHDNDEIYCKWDWDDGSSSGWFGPFDSGEEIITSHTWTLKGDYLVRVKLKDEYGLESSWSEPLLVHIKGPQLEIGDVKGGIRIGAKIKNIGDAQATDVSWNINIETRFPPKIKDWSDEIQSLQPKESETISTDEWLFGLGRVWITITAETAYAEPVEKEVTGFIFLFYVIILN